MNRRKTFIPTKLEHTMYGVVLLSVILVSLSVAAGILISVLIGVHQ